MDKKRKVFVGLSGGVDSSVAALRLIEQGYDVTGVFIKVWHPDFLVCNWEEERLSAMRVAAHLDIPFLTCDAEARYRDDVAQYFISEYVAGRTPNPDVMCNRHIKFGSFVDFAKAHKADFIATGHYARRIDKNGKAQLCRGIDKGKDQSYFLWTLTKEQLEYTLLPVGDSEKEVIRKEATSAGLPTATKKDSQGVCFLGHIDIPDFISHFTELKEGNVLNETGEVIGKHRGAVVYTLGQRHGFVVDTKDDQRSVYYVKAKNIDKNTITVSTDKPVLEKTNTLLLINTVLREDLIVGEKVQAQTRYRQEPFVVEVTNFKDNKQIELKPEDDIEAVAKGQSCVLYKDNLCLGGGIIA
ncbi:MAG: tRNA 2-thiouridine(34) synthase MnmA [Candidatus Paceibacterota bacterium]